MHRLGVICAFLSATPLVAQWTVTTYAGGTAPFDPLTDPSVSVGLALNPAGSFYVPANNTIWRVRAGGVAERFAGTGVSGYGGDGGPATAALLDAVFDTQTDASGNVYFWDQNNYRIRRVDPNGVITTVAGTGVPWVAGMDREGPATSRSLPARAPFIVRSSGDIYFADGVTGSTGSQYQIRHVKPSGELEVVGGSLDNCTSCTDGDRVPALAAHLKAIRQLAFDSRDNLYVVESFLLTPLSNFSTTSTIRRISPDGQMTRIAGCLVGPCGPGGDGQPALNQNLSLIGDLVADDIGNLYISQPPLIPGAGSIFVRRIGMDGLIQTMVQSGSATTATKDLQRLYVDSASRIVYRLGNTLRDVRDGSVTTTISPDVPTPAFVSSPDGTLAQDTHLPSFYFMAVSRGGELHFTEDCRVRKFDRIGVLRTVASLCDGLNPFVASIAFDSQDRLWVRSRTGNTSVYTTPVVLPDGQIIQQNLPQYLGNEGLIALDFKDRLYRMDNQLNRVEADGTVRRIEPPPPPANSFLSYNAIGSDPQGNIYFAVSTASSLQNTVYRVNDDGSVTQVATAFRLTSAVYELFVDGIGRVWSGLSFVGQTGTINPGLRGNSSRGDGGPVQSATFGLFQQAALGPDNTVYLAEGSRVRKLTPILQAPTPIISTGGILHSASYTGGSIAPGELISIFGSNFGPTSGVEVGQAVNNVLPSAVGRTKVLFGGIEGRITAVTPTQINVFVPFGLTIGSLVDVVVLVDDATSLPTRVPVAAQAFGLFTLDSSGSGQGAILNQDGSVNGPLNPTVRGNIVSLFGTGEGLTFPALPDGALEISTPYSKPNVPVTVKINGIDSEVLYAGSAPTLPTGAFQINVRIPLSLPRPGLPPPDPTVISVTVGSSTTTRNVTVAVQ